MKKRYSFALITVIISLTLLQTISAASTANALKKISSADLRTLLQKLEIAEKVYEESTQKLYSEFLNTIPNKTPKKNFLKAGIPQFVATLVAGYYLGMNHKKIESKFEELPRPAITLLSEIILPIKEQAEASFDKTSKTLKNKIKHITLKEPDPAETEENSDNKN